MTIVEKIPYYIETTGKTSKYWQELKNQNFVTTQCRSCSEIHFPPRTLCPKCYSLDLDWVNLEKEGIVESYTDVAVPPPGFEGSYILMMVNIKGLNKPILGRYIGSHPPEIGVTVNIGFENIDNITVPVFH